MVDNLSGNPTIYPDLNDLTGNRMADLHFVIQEHTTPSGVHWDLMLEHDEALWTWRLETPPEQIGNASVAAERIFDHAMRFLSYEGPVQNGTGRVQITDQGTLQWHTVTPSKMTCQLDGRVLNGPYSLTLTKKPFWEFKREV
jgi:hypothetical protein